MRSARPPIALTASIVVLAMLIVFSFLGMLFTLDFRAGLVVGAALIGLCLLVAWGVRGV